MRYISSEEIRENPATLWKEDEAVLTVNGKPRAVVIKIDGDPEKLLSIVRRIRAQIALEKLRMFSVENKLNRISMDEIDGLIDEIRGDIKP